MSKYPVAKACALSMCTLALAFVSLPLLADVDLSGAWGQKLHEDFLDRIGGPAVGDFTGLPLNEAARAQAESWDDARWAVPEHQCEAVPTDYVPWGPASMRVWNEVDPKTQQIIAWHMVYLWQGPHRVIWMDDRAHPPQGALHTWMGFSTGKWVGDTLVVTTTHLKAGFVRRNGVPKSDLGKLTEYWMRHGDYLTVVSVLEDPVYLTAPLIRSVSWNINLGYELGAYRCSPKVENDLPRGFVAHHLPGTNTALQDVARLRRLPPGVSEGGEESMYPDYLRKLTARSDPLPPQATRVALAKRDRTGSAHASQSVTSDLASRGLDPGVEVLPIRDNIFVVMSPTGNTTVQTGDDGILLVDTQRPELGPRILQEIQRLSSKPIRHIIDTSIDIDSTGGNELLGKAGRSIGPDDAFHGIEAPGAEIYAHENVLRAMSVAKDGKSARDTAAWPTDAYFTESTELFSNGDAVEIIHVPAARSDGDSIVHFRRSDVVSTGGVFITTGYPFIDLGKGGGINGVIEALNRVIDITVPEKNEEGGTLVIPGRGRVCDEYEVVAYRDMITIIRDRIQDMIHKGMTLEQIQAQRPTRGYDARYGSDAGPWTTQKFVEAIYRSLAQGAGT